MNNIPRIKREDILNKLRKQVQSGVPIIGSGAGVGLSAKCAEIGGADIIIIYNSGRFRMAGKASICGRFPFSNANRVVIEMADEIFPVVKHTPVIAGVHGSDPFREMERFLWEIAERGFSGVQNYPTMGSVLDNISTDLTDSGIGYDKEVEMVRLAHKLDLLTTPYCFNVEHTKAMVDAGADIIVAHMGLTSSGLIGSNAAFALDECVEKIKDIADTAVSINPDVFVICHGGSITQPHEAQYIFDRVENISGFFGASSAERLPVEKAIASTVKSLKQLTISEEGRVSQ